MKTFHQWFFAPIQLDSHNSQCIVVFLEHGGSGGKQAAPVVRRILEQYNRDYQLFAQLPAKTEAEP